ncbi:hypothetical protein [Arthrobacter sp. ISL-30]|uniref:hypothetical protein n=1 Tax=Arthrobacter sp. ISL-30 TaxID=2819109 RepID=UPI001BE84B7B|nr:hypothetical protein [Arthrobacter sp. ISL-30]MBT2513020.1 hypothetical protein [Arthrobacter sp. ISL-30]
MKRTIAAVGVAGLGMFGVTLAATVSANAAPGDDKKITICHATSSEGNAFVPETISVSALRAHTRDTLDIVPVNDGDVMPNGRNLTPANIAILEADCVTSAVPTPTPTVEPSVEPSVEPTEETAVVVQPPAEQPAAVQPAAVQPPAVQPAAVQPPAVQPPAVQPAAPKPAAVKRAPAAAPALAASNVGYNVQTAAGGTSAGIPTWLTALTALFTAGAALVLWRGGARARNANG